jgi:hypothetical protein
MTSSVQALSIAIVASLENTLLVKVTDPPLPPLQHMHWVNRLVLYRTLMESYFINVVKYSSPRGNSSSFLPETVFPLMRLVSQWIPFSNVISVVTVKLCTDTKSQIQSA